MIVVGDEIKVYMLSAKLGRFKGWLKALECNTLRLRVWALSTVGHYIV